MSRGMTECGWGVALSKARAVNAARHGPILLVDIDRFNRSEWSDEDRAKIRDTLQPLLRENVEVCFPDFVYRRRKNGLRVIDIGDGLGFLFPSDLPKRELLIRFIPA